MNYLNKTNCTVTSKLYLPHLGLVTSCIICTSVIAVRFAHPLTNVNSEFCTYKARNISDIFFKREVAVLSFAQSRHQVISVTAYAHSILFFFHFFIGPSSCSILGMYLFGGKFCKYVEDNGAERDCTCPEIVSHHPKCECDRKHFNNILWATVTVFQVRIAPPLD